MTTSKVAVSVCLAMALTARTAVAVNIETVPVGNPGNAADTRYATPGFGSVAYAYNIGKYEVTAGQYCEFLNAIAKTDTYGLYSLSMWNNQYGCKIQRSGVSGSYTYIVATDRENGPVDFVSWGSAARFCNWLTNRQPTGSQGPATTEDGAYYLNGLTDKQALLTISRKANARYVIPSEDEWYKAAYHRNDGITGNYWKYPTRTDTTPIAEVPPGGINSANFNMVVGLTTNIGAYTSAVGPYGTFDQGGNVWEWNESIPFGSSRGLRGGSLWGNYYFLDAGNRNSIAPQYESGYDIGFRIVEIPVLAPTRVLIARTTFDLNLEEWTFIGSGMLSHQISGGISGGFANYTDVAGSGGDGWIVAPSKYLGDWSALERVGTLSWYHAVLSPGGGPTFVPAEVVISGPGGSASYRSSTLLDTHWQFFSVPIDSSGWNVTGSWPALLANVTALQIRIEGAHNGGPTLDVDGVDTVFLGVPVGADFDHDGDVDADDITVFMDCATGPAALYDPAALPLGCELTSDASGHIAADFDLDGDIDQSDFGVFQRCYSGDQPSRPNCAD